MLRYIFKLFIILAFQCSINVVQSERILGFFPTLTKSHLIVHASISKALADAGHNVTVVALLPNPWPLAKYHYIEMETPHTNMSRQIDDLINGRLTKFEKFAKVLKFSGELANGSLSTQRMKRFMATEKSSFDLLVLGLFMNDFHLGLASHFRCPVVVSFMIQPVNSLNRLIGNPYEIAYVPSVFSGLSQPLKFTDRMKGFVTFLLERLVWSTMRDASNQEYYKEHFPSDKYPSFETVKKNVSLVLTNHHHISQGPIRPNVPALIDIGGIQIKEKPDPLPEDLATILDAAQDGVIYLSFGTNINAEMLSPERVKIMFDVLSQLPYKVLWKWDDTQYPGASPNIVYKSWLPQDDILAHPNVKLFITHGGQGSVVESQYHGVPMVGIPMFGDQPANVERFVRPGFGLRLDYFHISKEKFRNTIEEVISNPKYKEAVQRFSQLYRDRPMSSRQTAVFWIEYVLRHRGATHLQSPAVHLNLFQLMSLDVISFLLAIILSILWILIKIWRTCCGRRKETTVQQANKQKQK